MTELLADSQSKYTGVEMLTTNQKQDQIDMGKNPETETTKKS